MKFLKDIGGFTTFQFFDDKVILFFEVVMFGTPITAEVFRTDGKTFTVKAKNCSKKNKYIQSAKLNGKEFDRAWITHTEITAGGTLEFVMGDRPNKLWASDPSVFIRMTADK